jgi:monovalent cation/hydrogen antiporter
MPDTALIIGLLAVVAIAAAVGRRVGLADPIVFAIGGLALALVPGVPSVALPPALVLVVFLPPLIFAAAQDTSWTEIRREARPILLLAVGLVLVTMTSVAVVSHALAPDLSWAAAFTLGAIVSPPDTVAAKAIADTLHLPRRLVTILGGEGLINDATALVAFKVASGVAVAGSVFSFTPAAGRVAYAAVVSVLIGVLVGWIGRHLLSRVGDPAIENTVAVLLPFGAFLPAEAIHSSGVLAVVALALYLSRFSTSLASPTGRLQSRVIWEMIDFILTGLSFVLVGLQLRSSAAALLDRPTEVLVTTGAVCLTVIVIRPIWVFVTVVISRSVVAIVGETVPTTKSSIPTLVVISWAGMRGVISLAVALSLPIATNAGQPFPGRDLIVFVTFAVILVTLIGQGLTLPALVRRMGIGGMITKIEDQEIAMRLLLARAALRALDQTAEGTGASPDVVERVRGRYADRIERLERRHAVLVASDEARADDARLRRATAQLLQELTNVERVELQRLQNTSGVDQRLARRLQQGLDLEPLREVAAGPIEPNV